MLRVFPNPNTGVFTVIISSERDEETNIVITNVAGQKVKELKAMTNRSASLQLNVPAGIYFLSTVTAQGSYIVKVVVE